MEKYELIVVGAGPSGLAAALYAMERKMKIILLEARVPGGLPITLYADKKIYDYPAGADLTGTEWVQKIMIQVKSYGVEIKEYAPVTGIKKQGDNFTVTAAGEEHQTQTVLLAIGMSHNQPRQLGVEGETTYTGKGIFYQKLPDKVIGKRVVVIGGGDTAFETAISAAQKGASVTLVHRSDNFRAQEKTISYAKSLSIPILTQTKVTAFKGSGGLESLEIVQNAGAAKTLTCDIAIICIGMEPNTQFLQEIGVKVDRQAVVVDENLQTSIPGIFACGDIIVPQGKYKRLTVAVGSAATAINGIYQYLKNPVRS